MGEQRVSLILEKFWMVTRSSASSDTACPPEVAVVVDQVDVVRTDCAEVVGSLVAPEIREIINIK